MAFYLLFYGYISLFLLEEITDAEPVLLEEDIPVECIQCMLKDVFEHQKEQQKSYATILEQQQQQQQLLQQLHQQQQYGILYLSIILRSVVIRISEHTK